jgi:hypothetical protein
MKARLLTLITLVAISAVFLSQRGRAKLLTAPVITSLDAGAVAVKKTVEIGDSGPTEIHYVVFDGSLVGLKVVDQPRREVAKLLHDLLPTTPAFAGCNGGYFHVMGDFSPTGLQICDGQRIGVLGEGEHVGSLIVKPDGPRLCWPEEVLDDGSIQQLVQCSPWLVKAGKTFPSSPEEPRHRRTFIATDERGRWCIGCTSGIELSGLAALVADNRVIPELTVRRALNLDGGPSSGLWWRSPDGKDGGFPQPGNPVRNLIALFPKPKP